MSKGQNSKRLQKLKQFVRKKVVLHPCNTFLVLHGISFPLGVLFSLRLWPISGLASYYLGKSRFEKKKNTY